ncbi:MAG: DUF6077 domain-containing protein [Solirubrobacteraceae bacterium]
MSGVSGPDDRGSLVLEPSPQPCSPATRTKAQRDLQWLAHGCEGLLDLAVVVLSSWTVVYHVCLLLRLGAAWAVGFELVALTGLGLWWWRSHRRPDPARRSAEPARVVSFPTGGAGSSTVGAVLLPVTVVSAALAAVVVAVGASWPVAAALWLTAAIAGTGVAMARCRRIAGLVPAARDRGAEPPSRGGVVVALGWAVALAVLSMFTRSANPDDLYYVNLSQWVADHGTFPLRDTIFADLVFPMSSFPPVASYDALAGTLALLSGAHAASVVYLVVPPVATFLSVLALWRLLAHWGVRAVGVAVTVALVFLLFDGGPGYGAPGNLFLTRIWQGKVILLCLVVPLLLVYALRYVERPTRGRAGWLFAGGVAAVGLSTTAMFLVPLIALAGTAPLWVRRPRRAVVGFLSMAAYPLAAGAMTLAAGGRSADSFASRRLFRFDPGWFGPEILRDGPLAAIVVAAVLAGALLVPHRAARVTTGLLVVFTGVTFVPGVTQLSYDLVGLGPTLWRVSWVASIAALVGVLGARLATSFDRRSLRIAAPVALAVVLIAFGVPIWSGANGVSLDTPQWKRGPSSVVSAQQAVDAASPGDVILAPRELAISITVLTTRVKTVAPRAYFMDYLRDEPSFHYDERVVLVDFANQETGQFGTPEVARALSMLDVDQVCLPVESWLRIGFIRAQGYQLVASSATDRCFTRR